MKLFYRFIDRLVFAAGVLIFLQLPNFIDQYTQRMGGYYDAQKENLELYQGIADRYYEGDLKKLTEAFGESNEPAMKETADELEKISSRVKDLEEGLTILENGTFMRQVVYMIFNVDLKLARGTMKAYTPGMPFTSEGLLSGLVGGVIVSLLFNGVVKLVRLPIKKKKEKRAEVSRA